ncbi:MAG: hypothetical protein EA422_08795 [Gemmatimonadales bacterium]|nr:MAG: hypothetical protein EA422_08795 [Gemmatimonadales bacterium]
MSQRLPSSDRWVTSRGSIPLDPFLVMGILDLPADARSNGGDPAVGGLLLERALRMQSAGAGMLDLGVPGGGAVPALSEADELRRLIPALRTLAARIDLPISVNTRRASVARAALAEGVAVIHDVSGLSFDPEMVEVVAGSDAGLLLMHLRTDSDEGSGGGFSDLLMEVAVELGEATQLAVDAGIDVGRIALDPGIGFDGSPGRSLAMIREMGLLDEAGFPVVLGPAPDTSDGAAGAGSLPDGPVAESVVSALAWERGVRLFRVRHVGAVLEALTLVRQMVEDDPVAHAVDAASASGGDPDPPVPA